MAQNFFIRKNSELPILKMQIYNNGRDEFKNIFKELENATITFSMVDLNTGRHKVFNKPGIPIPMNKTVCPEETEYYIGYKFDKKDTNTPGLYRGEFKIDFMGDGCSLIVPIRDELHITILDSTTNSKIIC